MHLLCGLTVPKGPEISHIFYAKDCLLVAQASLKDAIALLAILNAYTTYSGQSINSTKSYIIFSLGTDCKIRYLIRELLHIAEKRMNWQYLGVPLSGKTSSADYQFLLIKISNKMAAWKWRVLSLVGRTCLIQSVLYAILLYALSSTHVPMSILWRIEKEITTFFWGHPRDRRTFHPISWEKVYLPKAEGEVLDFNP